MIPDKDLAPDLGPDLDPDLDPDPDPDLALALARIPEFDHPAAPAVTSQWMPGVLQTGGCRVLLVVSCRDSDSRAIVHGNPSPFFALPSPSRTLIRVPLHQVLEASD